MPDTLQWGVQGVAPDPWGIRKSPPPPRQPAPSTFMRGRGSHYLAPSRRGHVARTEHGSWRRVGRGQVRSRQHLMMHIPGSPVHKGVKRLDAVDSPQAT